MSRNSNNSTRQCPRMQGSYMRGLSADLSHQYPLIHRHISTASHDIGTEPPPLEQSLVTNHIYPGTFPKSQYVQSAKQVYVVNQR